MRISSFFSFNGMNPAGIDWNTTMPFHFLAKAGSCPLDSLDVYWFDRNVSDVLVIITKPSALSQKPTF